MQVTSKRSRWLSGRAIRLHCLTALAVPLCLAAGYWQADRALAGNALSYAYAVEWPLFAALSVWGWWQLLHAPPDPPCRGQTEHLEAVPPAWDPSSESPALRAYNERLQAMHQSGRPQEGGG